MTSTTHMDSPSRQEAPLQETSYGFAKRFSFVSDAIRAAGPRRILDIGCGTGELLTIPLALRFPEVSFVGAEPDASSVARAVSRALPANLSFVGDARGLPPFDFVIASEVLEHTDDPVDFLLFVRGLLNEGGRLVVTVPNGFGPFELATIVLNFANLSGAYPLYTRLKGARAGGDPADLATATLADSPHLNFFLFRELEALFAGTGFELIRYRPRTWLCGFVLDRMVGGRIEGWNARVSDDLPSWAASGWMFDLKLRDRAAARPPYARSRLDRLRVRVQRHVNQMGRPPRDEA